MYRWKIKEIETAPGISHFSLYEKRRQRIFNKYIFIGCFCDKKDAEEEIKRRIKRPRVKDTFNYFEAGHEDNSDMCF